MRGCTHQKKKNGLWYCILTGPRDSNGKYKRKWSKGFETRKEADIALTKTLYESGQVDVSPMTWIK